MRQMPGDDYEALMGENDKVYSQESIDVVTRSVEPVEKIPVYMIVGDDIPEKREPDQSRVWYGEDAPPRLKTHWITKKDTRLDWMFVPLKVEPENSFNPLEKFLIFEEPREDGRRVETRQTQPLDRAGRRDQRDDATVADCPVVEGEVGTRWRHESVD